MNVSQDKPSIRFVGQADFASEVLQSGKPVLAVFIAPWSRPCQVFPKETAAADTKPASLPSRFVSKKPIAQNQWFCRLTQKVTEAADPQAAKILLCSPACALRHFASNPEPTMSTKSKTIVS